MYVIYFFCLVIRLFIAYLKICAFESLYIMHTNLIINQGYIEHRDCLLKLAADSSAAKQKVTLCTFFPM